MVGWTDEHSNVDVKMSGDIHTELPQLNISVDNSLNIIQWLQSHILMKYSLNNWRIRHICSSLTAMKSPVSVVFLICPSDSKHYAGYSPKYNTIWMCGNRLWSPLSFRQTLTHELVHAFDFARAEIDVNSCDQLACCEVRANHLSGECNILPSFLTQDAHPNALTSDSQLKRCVSSKAIESLRENKNCQGKWVAEAATARVLEKCVSDIFPFSESASTETRWRCYRATHTHHPPFSLW
eukprot:GHVR01097357.1.p1 GENE.GHVR01097357.1~~GHVR01097357.1.p1  ORF type:complete len:238 (+),score=48.51 GHVR01097357.1:97-810(+)